MTIDDQVDDSKITISYQDLSQELETHHPPGYWTSVPGGPTGTSPSEMCFARISLVVQWLGLHALALRAWVRSLVGELRSRKPEGAAKKKKTLYSVT